MDIDNRVMKACRWGVCVQGGGGQWGKKKHEGDTCNTFNNNKNQAVKKYSS